MPSAASKQNNYYASHQRRLSQSQTSLPDQLRSSRAQSQASNGSLIFLPSTAYSQSDRERSRAASVSAVDSERVGSDFNQSPQLTDDLDAFYQQHQNPILNSSQTSLPQASSKRFDEGVMPKSSQRRKSSLISTRSHEDNASRKSKKFSDLSNSSADPYIPADVRRNATAQTGRSASNPPRLRQASFKDLVARFDAASDDVPLAPSRSLSRVNSFSISPIAYTNSQQIAQPSSSRAYHQVGQPIFDPDQPYSSASFSQEIMPPEVSTDVGELPVRKRPLFGEVIQGQIPHTTAGYGISKARRRRGSEGSPMHTPTAMFSTTDETPRASAFPTLANENRIFGESQHSSIVNGNLARHRRANSDLPKSQGIQHQSNTRSQEDVKLASKHNHGHARWASTSQIDVGAQNIEQHSNNMINVSALDSSSLYEIDQDKAPNASTKQLFSAFTSTNAQPGVKRKPESPVQIMSPGRQARTLATSQGEKSPSLRATIIAPPPKISPPLRSSRPRLPVSVATTATSRAKMAEKFQLMAREQSERKHSTRRSRPPELTDVDLKARRLKITQALSRSREGQDLRSDTSLFRQNSVSGRSSITASASETDETSPMLPSMGPRIPGLYVESSSSTGVHGRIISNNNDFPEQRNGHRFVDKHRSLKGSLDGDIDDESSPSLRYNQNAEKRSIPDQLARTVHRFSAHSQVTKLQDPSTSSLVSTQSNSEDLVSDRGDEESVRIILRDTTYMDEDEAVQKGYRGFAPQSGLLNLPNTPTDNRGSWTSSITESSEIADENDDNECDDLNLHMSRPAQSGDIMNMTFNENRPESSAYSCTSDTNEDSTRNTVASDAYTIVNIVLQQRSPSGIVDQQLVDDIYQRILTEEPSLVESEEIDAQRVEELCLQELQHESKIETPDQRSLSQPLADDGLLGESSYTSDIEVQQESSSVIESHPPVLPKASLSPTTFRGHRYKSSLDSAEDWAETSPSVSDWMRFALNENSDSAKGRISSPLTRKPLQEDASGEGEGVKRNEIRRRSVSHQKRDSDLSTSNAHLPPSHSPPPRPISKSPSKSHTPVTANRMSQGSVSEGPIIPQRTTSSSQRPRNDRPLSMNDQSVGRPSVEDQLGDDLRRSKQRRHVIKEIVDTEYSYERDLRVLCDIYKQTAAAALSEVDIKILFGNIEQVQQFARDFLFLLKQVVRPAYVMERPERMRNQDRVLDTQAADPNVTQLSSTGDPDQSNIEKDHQTRVGQAFEASMSEMEKVYTEYIRGRHAGNKRLEQLQGASGVREWLRECSSNSNDITNAWSLDALLVKPIQRITKYPLLLNQLLGSTSSNHPDYLSLRHALLEVTEINVRINEVKKHTELVDQVLNRKRKESDVRNGLTKAFGRRAEKLRQHVGINEMYEDTEYARMRMDFDNNGVHLLIVSKDCQGYIDAIKGWVSRMYELALAAEAWIDVGHTNHAEAESKLRQLAIAVRGISSIGLPDHVEQVWKRVIRPMERANALMDRFKNDPRGLIQKREKKLLDYGQVRNKRDRGEKLDRRMVERMEQWEALNLEAKKRMKKLLFSTAVLVQSCLKNLIQLHLSWLTMCNEKFSSAMSIPLSRLGETDLVREWQVDYDFQEASALALSICNGSLLAEAVNMVSVLTPGSTLTGDESPRQVSWNSINKRSISMHSESSRVPSSDLPLRASQDYHRENSFPQQSTSQLRTTSVASNRTPKTPERFQNANGYMPQLFNNTTLAKPSSSSRQSDEISLHAPRLSLDTPSPSIGPLGPNSPSQRPSSSSTFFSAVPAPTGDPLGSIRTGSSIFSSAMPMSDSPVTDQTPGIVAGDEPPVLFAVASVNEFNIDRSRQEGGIPYLTYVTGEIFDVIGERGELWLARNQDDPTRLVGWIWNKHFAKLAE